MAANGFLNSVTIVTIALSILIVGVFVLLLVNGGAVMDSWMQGIRMTAYLETGVSREEIPDNLERVLATKGVEEAVFVSREEGFEKLKAQMKDRSSLLDSLAENPLPDAFEISVKRTHRSAGQFKKIASEIEAMPSVAEVEYGRKWLERFTNVFQLFKLTGYAAGCLFFMAAVFFVANTIRLVLYSRREEIEIMRLVGATDNFIKIPFYIQSVVQCVIGGLIGLSALFAAYRLASVNVDPELLNVFEIRFLEPKTMAQIVAGTMLVGWMGCYVSLRQFLKF